MEPDFETRRTYNDNTNRTIYRDVTVLALGYQNLSGHVVLVKREKAWRCRMRHLRFAHCMSVSCVALN